MSFKTVLRRNTDLRQDSKRSSSPESPMRDSFAPIDSRIRVNSEPSRPRMPASLNKSHLPDIEPTHKKAFIGAYVNTSLLSGKNKAGGTYLRDKSPSFEESPVQANKAKKNNNSMEVYSSTPQKYKGLDISTDSVKKSLLQPGSFSPSPLKFKTQTNVGRSITPNKPFAYELSDITSKAKSRMYSGANSKVKRVEQKAKPEPLSTSVNASPLQHRLDATKCSLRKNGVVEAYAANSNQGIVRNYNEDRVSIILNVTQPSFTEYQGEWPNCSFFGVYDGHGGSRCADFLKDNLHKFVMGNRNFPANPTLALQEGFREAEAEFLSLAQRNKLNVDQSGSCAVVALILDNKCYIANVGDSRAVLSGYKGLDIMPLSRDHKPCDENEQERIFANGGKLYQSPVGPQGKPKVYSEPQDSSDPQFGPLRVLPGRLAVSRTFGDIEAKFEKFGGNPNVVVAEPEIRVVELNDNSDFLILASDGIFDRLSNEDVNKSVWDSMKHKCSSIHEQASQAAESVMMDALLRKTFDNITVVILAFAGFKAALTVPEEKKEAPINFYQSLEKPTLVKKSTLPIKAKVNNLSSEMVESQGSEERAQTTPDESAGVIEKDTTNFSLESVHKARPQSITRQLIRAYKKSPVIVGPK